MKLKEIAELVGGSLIGDPHWEVKGIKEPGEAQEDDLILFYHFPYLEKVLFSSAKAVITKPGMEGKLKGKNVILVDNPRYAFSKLVPYFFPSYFPEKGVHPQAFIHPQAFLGKNVSIGPFVVAEEGATIGDDTVIFPQVYLGRNTQVGKGCIFYPQVVVRENCWIGDRVILHSGVVIGADGFGYERAKNNYYKIPQVGKVVIEEDVEIGANSTVDRATLGVTRIGAGSKIDNLVMIAHNVKIGKNVVIVAQSGVAGSTEVGDDVVMGAQSGIIDHRRVGKGVQMAARTVVTTNIPDDVIISGFPAQEHKKELKEKALIRKLPELWEKIKNLEKTVSKQVKR
ncbi:UDP-3-O-(3-hydroxymyristoyl)glucosamine N-acyltransferase [Candidatus Sordicultor fermentans]|uniref:UDP-3-O-(3-hydroxymyristoyl)glucosamine N-acyltransferase n=1 Tax=Candidatus Sordicultor fermentans TaxID=1953203 RepID=UPI001695B198|nr:UDP-3-O-(3-hydroxymyristoyl)glucosamine N-acyltransferase [Atribacterota bacterium]NLY05834.1 UDP-3-O-(3-hydroxymyristoyl)glucosamine N-acyltransferase [Candidatus Atribacteria bacterium]MDI9607000.1 UDP-3-O-(3-hydroxymyristoyl)glucosamine N-acyltransferase [Atribacterota bacterium]MDY0134979.1 UDP-3-O-(3-hydroxymyristoyl)glucosamine N-acyltransferase [Atribacterota bacterium]HOA99680.1 UDP-3-O-(3-hydroxymyristoyl)glucosamine N-acyltransferase [Candidatus Atribacteria bacterium]